MDYRNDDLPTYPNGAPFRQDEASRAGARKVNADGSRMTQCAFALAAIDQAGPAGTDAYRVYGLPDAPFRDLSTCRARFSDLKAQGLIAKKGERTPGEAGVAVNLWIAARFAPPPVDEEQQADLFDNGAPSPGQRHKLTIQKPFALASLAARYAPPGL